MTAKSKDLQQQWEKILEKNGLGLALPLTDNSEGELADAATARTKKDNVSADYEKLRHKIDGSDLFMGAHGIKKIRTKEREIPEWAMDNKAVQKIITEAFPALSKSEVSRKRAGRWARFIYLYYRMQLPRQIVAKELGLSKIALRDLVRNVNRASQGRSVRGGKRQTKKALPS